MRDGDHFKRASTAAITWVTKPHLTSAARNLERVDVSVRMAGAGVGTSQTSHACLHALRFRRFTLNAVGLILMSRSVR